MGLVLGAVGTSWSASPVAAQSYEQRVQQRQERFLRLMRAEATKDPQKTKERQIRRALTEARNPRSEFRKDAIRFLVEVKAVETTPELIKIGRTSPQVRDEVVVAMNRFATKDAIGYLIDCLNDESDTIRNISYNGLRTITNQDFNYRSEDTPLERGKSQAAWKSWWEANRETFKRVEKNREDQEEADEIWKKYGLQYLNK